MRRAELLARALPCGLAGHAHQVGQALVDDGGHAHPVRPVGLDAQHLAGLDAGAGQVGRVIVEIGRALHHHVPG